jgi:PBP1b-binding outer membrane lipoprotein LpoB
MVRRTATTVATTVALVALALTGCSGSSGDSAASPSSSPSSSASSSAATPSPSVTEVADGTLDQNVLAEAITTNLTDSLGAGIALTVVCPPGVAIEQGATSTCSAVLDGQQLEFTVTQADEQGNVDFAANSAVLDVVKLQTQTAQQYGEQKGGVWTADCGAAGKAYLVQSVGATFECTFTAADGATQPYTVTVTDIDGNISWAEQ